MNLVPPQQGGQRRDGKQARDRGIAHVQPPGKGAEGGQDQPPPVGDEAGSPHAPAIGGDAGGGMQVARDFAGRRIGLRLMDQEQAAQRQGLGARLLIAMARIFADQGARSLMISTLRDNLPARRFYEHLGGQAEAPRREPGPGGTVFEVRYLWQDIRTLVQ